MAFAIILISSRPLISFFAGFAGLLFIVSFVLFLIAIGVYRNPILRIRTSAIFLIGVISFIFASAILYSPTSFYEALAQTLVIGASITALVGVEAFREVHKYILKGQKVWGNEFLEAAIKLSVMPMGASAAGFIFAIFALISLNAFWINISVLSITFGLILSIEILLESLLKETGFYQYYDRRNKQTDAN